MIGRDELARLVSGLDTMAEQEGFEAAIASTELEFDLVDGLLYVAEQRALRAWAISNGQLGAAQAGRPMAAPREELSLLTATWMDGFVAGAVLGRTHAATTTEGKEES